MKIMIAGSGGMGCRFGLMLHNGGNEVTLIDGWKENVNQINKNGLQGTLNNNKFLVKLPIFFQGEQKKSNDTDLIILFTKAMQLESMLQSIKNSISEKTKVLCLLNGIGHEEIIKKYVNYKNILIGSTMWTAALVKPGYVNLSGNGSVHLKNLNGVEDSTAMKIVDLLTKSNLNASYSKHVFKDIYKKACVNATMNSLCTLLEANMATLGKTSNILNICEQIVEEFCLVAKYEKINLNKHEIMNNIKNCFDINTIGSHYPSMYQDLIVNKRLTEIDYINGIIVKKGKKYQISTPYCNLITQLIHTKEQILNVK